MSVRRKAIVALAALAVIVGAWWLWPRKVYRYQGKTVEQWFEEVDWTPPNVDPVTGLPVAAVDDPAREAFRKMETNTAPFLANRITRNRDSLLERWTSRLHDMIKAHTVILYTAVAALIRLLRSRSWIKTRPTRTMSGSFWKMSAPAFPPGIYGDPEAPKIMKTKIQACGSGSGVSGCRL